MNNKLFTVFSFTVFAVLISYLLASQHIAYSETSIEADIIAGQGIYTQCSGCHAPDYHRTGPKHCGIIGRLAGSQLEFEYTTAMKNANIVWTKDTLDQFLKAPLEMISGTSMGYAGIASIQEREQLIAFLSSLTESNPVCK